MTNKPKKKDPYADLSPDFKSTIDSLSPEEIHLRIAQVTLDREALAAAKENDEDLKQKKEAASEAGAVYRTGFKEAKLKIRYLRRALQDAGKPSGDSGIEGADDDMPVDSV